MDDEVLPSAPPNSPSSPLPKASDGMEETTNKENEQFKRPHEMLLKKKGVNGGRDEEAEMRMPFRKVSSSPSSSSAGGKKKPTQKQKTCGGMKRIKCVLIGDSKTGKTALVQSFLQGQSTPEHVPTTQDDHIYNHVGELDELAAMCSPSKVIQENGDSRGKRKELSLHICDTGGQEEMDRLRPLCYSQAQMVIICFSVMNPVSFANVTLKWLPEVKRHCMVTEDPENPLKLVLVGTQSDLRSNVNMLLKLMDDGHAPISETQALRLASKIGALKYVESSAVTRSNVNHIFQLATTYGNGKVLPRQIAGFEMDTGFQGKFLPNLTERKLLFWRRWRIRQNKSSKMKRLALLPCLF